MFLIHASLYVAHVCVFAIQEQGTDPDKRVEHHQPGALQPQRRDHGEQEEPCPRGGAGEKEQGDKLLLMVTLLLACRADGSILCLALLVLCKL